jgi:hypothetical protein
VEIDYAKEKTRRNVKIIAWILIVMNVLGIYQGAGGNPKLSLSFKHFDFTNMKESFFNFTDFPIHVNVIIILSMILSIMVVIYAFHTLQFKEKGREMLAKLMVVEIIFQIISAIIQIVFTMEFTQGFRWMLNTSLIITTVVLIFFTIAMTVMYYFFYRFLNKPETRSVFVDSNILN